ncbi:hypothetical protein LR48_Vigan03g138900 [Vigna angularis]|uniref:Uncharacterized protein n=1 Tax=Phaseolus angularis TaxID=3914 RepID=A0A0L9U5S9_PHAAN|nr:hypothetical protein LR48_Vigan03g138900 [Vigna angularis]
MHKSSSSYLPVIVSLFHWFIVSLGRKSVVDCAVTVVVVTLECGGLCCDIGGGVNLFRGVLSGRLQGLVVVQATNTAVAEVGLGGGA